MNIYHVTRTKTGKTKRVEVTDDASAMMCGVSSDGEVFRIVIGRAEHLVAQAADHTLDVPALTIVFSRNEARNLSNSLCELAKATL